jgi:hypothetical protein
MSARLGKFVSMTRWDWLPPRHAHVPLPLSFSKSVTDKMINSAPRLAKTRYFRLDVFKNRNAASASLSFAKTDARLVNVLAPAGTGKSKLLGVIARSFEAAGYSSAAAAPVVARLQPDACQPSGIWCRRAGSRDHARTSSPGFRQFQSSVSGFLGRSSCWSYGMAITWAERQHKGICRARA